MARARLVERAVTSGRVDDADSAVIERRIQIFHAETGPLLDYYREREVLVAVDGTGPAAAVSHALFDALARREL